MSLKDSLKINRIGNYFIPALKKHPVWSLLLVAFLLIVYALIIFGANAVNDAAPASNTSNLQIDKELYQQVLLRLQNRDANIRQGIDKNYPNIFR